MPGKPNKSPRTSPSKHQISPPTCPCSWPIAGERINFYPSSSTPSTSWSPAVVTATSLNSSTPSTKVPSIGYSEELLDMLIYYHLKENISSARKVFRLFRFFDEIKGLAKIIKTNRPFLFKLLSVFTYFCSCSYYICDNSLWFLGILIKSVSLSKNIPKEISDKFRLHKKDLKRSKNTFSLFRVVAYMIILLYSIFLDTKHSWQMMRDLKKLEPSAIEEDEFSSISAKRIFSQIGYSEEKKRKVLDDFDSAINFDSNCKNQEEKKKLTKSLIEIRRRIRFYYLEVVISVLRMIMLTSSLRLKHHEKLDPIFVACCGLFSSTLNLIKTIFEKKIIVKVDKEEVGKNDKKDNSMALI